MSKYNYKRRATRAVNLRNAPIGGDNPIRLQSMTNTLTTDVEASARQAEAIAAAGGEIVRLTTQGVREAEAMADIKKKLLQSGCHVPVVADVHFNPQAAYTAARTSDKVRINPGNFVDAARTFRKLEFTDEEYNLEIDRIRRALLPFLDICRENGTAVRLGVNHGSLSDRIMSRYGDTPEGMVESVMEYLRVCNEASFGDVVISIKASNTTVMVRTVRLLAEAMDREGMDFPLHLGVTEAGDGEDGRIKSAVGIGTLLAEGLGDTIRVSLSEDPELEIPVARLLRDYITGRHAHAPIPEPQGESHPERLPIPGVDTSLIPAVAGFDFAVPDEWPLTDASTDPALIDHTLPIILTSRHINPVGEIRSFADRMQLLGKRNPLIVKLSYADTDRSAVAVKAAADFGALLLDGYASAIWPEAPALSDEERNNLALSILQAARLRFSKPEYISCPSCGRTLFDLQQTLAEVKRATSHLKGLKIGVMGCIVNGPGEMADADYGYVGAGPGRVSIYKGKQLIEKNIPAQEAIGRLVALIRECGDWQDPR